jgi:hypothetical protein
VPVDEDIRHSRDNIQEGRVNWPMHELRFSTRPIRMQMSSLQEIKKELEAAEYAIQKASEFEMR